MTIRIATIQCRSIPTLAGLRANPYADDFVPADLWTAVERRLAWFEDLFRRAAAEGCRLAVATEDFTGLSQAMTFLDDRSLFRNAVARQTPLVAERIGALARECRLHIVACYYAVEGDAIFNVADLFDAQGERRGRYRKVHLPVYERWQVAAGDTFPAFETELGWIGMLICYDQVWPESAACCALNGAQLVCHPSAAELPDFQMRTRATDSRVHYLSSTGRNSMIASPRGEILACAGEAELAIAQAEADLRAPNVPAPYFYETLYSGIDDHKERHLKLRRPDAYRPLLDREPPLAQQYPAGGVADTPAAIAAVYQAHKKIQQQLARGERVPYHWNW